ncbi:hypothetical protein F5Y09DRAFT_14014 [Xylaria sp. FL1042]|nr:hypothetical protein F5Y09DRAFT_14014 [Xylaria sp. FL1042]
MLSPSKLFFSFTVTDNILLSLSPPVFTPSPQFPSRIYCLSFRAAVRTALFVFTVLTPYALLEGKSGGQGIRSFCKHIFCLVLSCQVASSTCSNCLVPLNQDRTSKFPPHEFLGRHTARIPSSLPQIVRQQRSHKRLQIPGRLTRPLLSNTTAYHLFATHENSCG